MDKKRKNKAFVHAVDITADDKFDKEMDKHVKPIKTKKIKAPMVNWTGEEKMTKKYKIARSVDVIEEETTSYRYKYTCPFCKTNFIEYTFNPRILRIKCSHCDNEIIIKSIIKPKYKETK